MTTTAATKRLIALEEVRASRPQPTRRRPSGQEIGDRLTPAEIDTLTEVVAFGPITTDTAGDLSDEQLERFSTVLKRVAEIRRELEGAS